MRYVKSTFSSGWQKGFTPFLRTSQPTEEEWLQLIEARRELISRRLDSFTLTRLWDFPCLKTGGKAGFHDMSWDGPNEQDTAYDHDRVLQGIFLIQPPSLIQRSGDWRNYDRHSGPLSGTMKICGLTRSNKWVLITVDFIGERRADSRHKDRIHLYEKAISLTIHETDLQTIIAQTGEEAGNIWLWLGQTIKGWRDQRQLLLLQAQMLVEQVELEEHAFSLIQNLVDLIPTE